MYMSGQNNINWRGGSSEYPNHYVMKKTRLIKLREAKYICEECGGVGDQIHHIDMNKSNHNLDNLRVLCIKCHRSRYHSHSTSKFIRLYGFTIDKIAENLKVHKSKVYLLHRANLLKSLVDLYITQGLPMPKKISWRKKHYRFPRYCVFCNRQLVKGKCLCGRVNPPIES